MPNMTIRKRTCAAGLALAALLGTIATAAAQAFPTRPVTIVVPYPAGGLFDGIARALAEGMRVPLGQSVVVENVGGAGGSIAVGRVARAAPDGYTIAIGSGDQFVINAAIYPLQYDVVRDFEPISLLMDGPNLIVSKNAVPATNLKELTAWLKANAKDVSSAHNGAGGALHLCGIELQRVTGATWPFVPYRGAAPALQDVVGGRIDAMCTSPASSLSLIRGGLVRGYAITTTRGSPPRRTSRPPRSRDFRDSKPRSGAGCGRRRARRRTRSPSSMRPRCKRSSIPPCKARLTDLGQIIMPREQQTPEALAALQKAEIDKWWPVIKSMNIKAE